MAKINFLGKLPEIFIGFSKPLVFKALEKLNLDDEKYNDNDLEKLYNYFKDMMQKIEINHVSCEMIDKDFTLIPLRVSDKLNVNRFVDDYYFNKEQKKFI